MSSPESLERAREWIGDNADAIWDWNEQLEGGERFAPSLAALLDAVRAEERANRWQRESDIIYEAQLQERERCAKIAETQAPAEFMAGQHEVGSGVFWAARNIAAAIRTAESPEAEK